MEIYRRLKHGTSTGIEEKQVTHRIAIRSVAQNATLFYVCLKKDLH